MKIPKGEATRETILTAGMKLVRKKGIAGTTIADVAAAAGVTRQTIYFYFGQRAGLLAEIVRHHDVTRGRPIFAATQMPPSAASLEAFVRAWFAYLPEIFPVALELQSLSATDRDARQSWLARQNALKAMAATILRGLSERARLRPVWTVNEASEWLCAQLFPSQWQGLVVERKWRPERFVDRTVAIVVAELIDG